MPIFANPDDYERIFGKRESVGERGVVFRYHHQKRGGYATAARSVFPCPQIIRDGMDPILSMADGKMYDSKSTYYRKVKEAGLEIVGNEELPSAPVVRDDPVVTPKDVKDAYEKAHAELGYGAV